MKNPDAAKLSPVPFTAVQVEDGFWKPRLETNRRVTLPAEYEQCKNTGRIDAWKLEWKKGDPNPPHIFWDSDVGKWLEAAAYSLATHRDPKLEALCDEVIERIAKAQQPDGYLNVHFTIVEPEKRWTNLRDWHELYCAGHLMEAAAAYAQATGKRKILEVLCRYADHIARTFGPDEGRKRGYCGHPEVELALVKLYRATGEKRYLELAKFFVDERGRQPHYYDQEARARGEDPKKWWAGRYEYCQAHAPLREQETAEGHSVRALYLFSGMADVAAETNDAGLLAACRRLWKNVTRRRMYVTGGVGSSCHGERFTVDYDLPNETAYAETCANIALVFFAHRMLQAEGDGEYADVMERALYNSVLSGIGLDGKSFFYANPLAAYPPLAKSAAEHVAIVRQKWFGCACCPPNIARLLASFGQYAYSRSDDELAVNLYVKGRAEANVAGRKVSVEQETGYPWCESVRLTLRPERPAEFALSLRIPGWCRGAKLKVNGKAANVGGLTKKGYARVKRVWTAGDQAELTLPMPVERIEAHPSVRMGAGKVALQRGPLVYCLEEADNGKDLADLRLPRSAKLKVSFDRGLLGGVAVITGKALRRDAKGWDGVLYRRAAGSVKQAPIKAIPYCLWSNRGMGEMAVWIREA